MKRKAHAAEHTLLESAEQSWAHALKAAQHAERLIEEWVQSEKISSAEGARLLAQFLKRAQRGQRHLQRRAHAAGKEALATVAGATRHQLDDLQEALAKLSRKLKSLERPARVRRRAPGRTSRAARPAASRARRPVARDKAA
jgi:polyhydroxyalkanoate synthesis regulator phasin